MMPGMGMGMDGMGMMGMGRGGMGMGVIYGRMGGGGMGSQWIMSLNQSLFGIQSVVFLLGQAVQIVWMNVQQIRQGYDSMKGIVDNTLGQVHKLGGKDWLEDVMGAKGEGARQWIMGDDESRNDEQEEIFSQSEIIQKDD